MRITPAHAGKRNRKNQFGLTSRDHPRTRGEKREYFIGMKEAGGSPPHTRGKVRDGNIESAADRITPAHAGKSLYGISHIPGFWDHPRTRGEKPIWTPKGVFKFGSPPHTRGKVNDCYERG